MYLAVSFDKLVFFFIAKVSSSIESAICSARNQDATAATLVDTKVLLEEESHPGPAHGYQEN